MIITAPANRQTLSIEEASGALAVFAQDQWRLKHEFETIEVLIFHFPPDALLNLPTDSRNLFP